ncbi:MAG TPA: 3-oxoacyl-[acyl-carrier-protein] synthase III C-terminal domain-containing protein [Thermobifida alba]|nr:3-oxoacyl-[acyl-carrier-protein] synthase III C-terminal domain-containing protein [Thermobifida alba]
MADLTVDIGIASLGFAFGTDQDVAQTAGEYVPDPERVLKWGYRTFHRAADDVHATDLAATAAHQALQRAGTDAHELDLVVLATSDMPERSYWDSASALAGKLGIERTQTLLLNEGCASGINGFFYVAAAMAMRPEADTVLFAVVNRVSEFHRNRMNVFNSVLSDGAAAAVIRRGHPANRWLASASFTVPRYNDLISLDFGGTVQPLPPQGWSSRTAPSGYDRIDEHFGNDPARLRRFLGERVDYIREVIDEACARAGITRGDIDHVIYTNDSPASITAIAQALDHPPHRTNAELSPEHGHMGAADQLVSLGQHIERGDVHPGDVVALCGISTGMQWCCTLLRI